MTTLTELKQQAKALGIKGYSTMRVSDLRGMIELRHRETGKEIGKAVGERLKSGALDAPFIEPSTMDRPSTTDADLSKALVDRTTRGKRGANRLRSTGDFDGKDMARKTAKVIHSGQTPGKRVEEELAERTEVLKARATKSTSDTREKHECDHCHFVHADVVLHDRLKKAHGIVRYFCTDTQACNKRAHTVGS